MKAVIMAGGRGTRVSSIAKDIPKPMIKIGGKPILEHEIRCLNEQGINDIIIAVSHLANVIMDYFKDGRAFGVNIRYYIEDTPLGTAGALFKLKQELREDFLLLNSDILFSVDMNRLIEFHRNKNALVTLFTHPNTHPEDSGLIVTDSNNVVVKWITKEEERPKYYRNCTNAGIHIISPKILNQDFVDSKIDLDRQILRPLIQTCGVFSYNSPEYVHDMGTPERLKEVREAFNNSIVQLKDLRNSQKAIFLDRDGTINKYVGFLTDIEKFQLRPRVSDAIRFINKSGYLAIVVTNQPVIARGEISYSQLDEIHNKMETLLGVDGAYLDGIYYCPHHPDKGFEGEVAELKMDCSCRKPKPGLFFQAAAAYNIDLSKSWMIGDDINDIYAGENAGCRCILIDKQDDGKNSLISAVKQILERGQYG